MDEKISDDKQKEQIYRNSFLPQYMPHLRGHMSKSLTDFIEVAVSIGKAFEAGEQPKTKASTDEACATEADPLKTVQTELQTIKDQLAAVTFGNYRDRSKENRNYKKIYHKCNKQCFHHMAFFGRHGKKGENRKRSQSRDSSLSDRSSRRGSFSGSESGWSSVSESIHRSRDKERTSRKSRHDKPPKENRDGEKKEHRDPKPKDDRENRSKEKSRDKNEDRRKDKRDRGDKKDRKSKN
ncbi:pre-mRNA-splicing factor 38B-like [Phymastichus coffea]|uniref:pre-mRNA-splicing factor 38B-like n=1 Tax=Phymastichus coffea TaxID=108790 RepID=UPI00273BC95B|nr:pre-mRNA-splicing factor 38B-like [Phymastichus coffea]